MQTMNLTEQQAAILEAVDTSILLRGPDGHVLGIVSRGMTIRTTEDEVAFALRMQERAKNGSPVRYTTHEVLDHLQALE